MLHDVRAARMILGKSLPLGVQGLGKGLAGVWNLASLRRVSARAVSRQGQSARQGTVAADLCSARYNNSH